MRISVLRSGVLVALAACSAPAPASKPTTPTERAPVDRAAETPLEPPGLRLPAGVRPKHYALDLTVLPTAETFSGKVTIALELDAAAPVVWLHGADLTIKSATFRSPAGEVAARATAAGPRDDTTKDMISFVPERPVGPGAVELTIVYDGKLPANQLDGLHRQLEQGEWYVFTQFEAIDARRAFPCFDEPAFKVPLQLTLHVKSEHVAVSNAPAIGETPEPGGMKAVRFAETKPLPTYLIALAVGPFDIVDGGKSKHGVPLRIIAPKGRGAEAGHATRTTPEILGVLEDYFGVPYPYEKLDQIAVPRKGGAMENAGLITYASALLLARPEEETIGRKRGWGNVAAHELAHHWFGNLVTLAWWDDIWLNESFATWMAEKATARWQPSWQVEVDSVTWRSYAMTGDSLATARKIRQPITSRHDIAAAFDNITYGKGGAILAMLEQWIGADKFQKGLRRYFEKHAHGVATTADFLAAISAEAGVDVAPVFSSYLDQVGTPLVTAKLVCDAGAPPKLALSQRRYTPIGSKAAAEQTWQIPVCAKFGTGDKADGRACTLLTGKTGELALAGAKGCPKWVLANEGELGYYRTQYEPAAIEPTSAKVLTTAERVGLIDDLAALVDAGQVPAGTALERVPALAGDASYRLVGAGARMLDYLDDELVAKELRGNRARFLRKMFGERARKLGWTAAQRETDDQRLLRPLIVGRAARGGEDPALIATAKQLADKWLADKKAIDPDMVREVLRIAARNSGRELFERLRAAVKVEKPGTMQRWHLLAAMSSFRDPEVVKAALAIMLTDELAGNESFIFGWSAFGEEATRGLAFAFVKQHLDALLAKLPRDSGGTLIDMTGQFCDAQGRADVAAFFKDRAPTYLNGPRSYATTLERIDLCIEKRRVHEASIRAFLAKY